MNHPFKGAGVALVTPFTGNNEIDFDALEKIIENQLKGGIDYFVALGTTAEIPTLTQTEKCDLVRFIKAKSSGKPVVVGMGGNNTENIIEQINTYDFEGINGVLIITPYYNKPTQEGMYRHYSAIAKESPVPIILYNVPSRTGVNLNADTVIRLANDSEKIVAVKEASGNLAQMARINKYTPESFAVISGDDILTLPTIAVGGIGVISVVANAIPKMLCNMVHFAINEEYEKARKLHYELLELFNLLFKEGNPGGIKALLNVQGIINNELRLPLYKVSEKTYNEIEKAYKDLI